MVTTTVTRGENTGFGSIRQALGKSGYELVISLEPILTVRGSDARGIIDEIAGRLVVVRQGDLRQANPRSRDQATFLLAGISLFEQELHQFELHSDARDSALLADTSINMARRLEVPPINFTTVTDPKLLRRRQMLVLARSLLTADDPLYNLNHDDGQLTGEEIAAIRAFNTSARYATGLLPPTITISCFDFLVQAFPPRDITEPGFFIESDKSNHSRKPSYENIPKGRRPRSKDRKTPAEIALWQESHR